MSENFEQRVKNILGEVQFEPHDEVWYKVKNAIKPEKKKRRLIFWWLLPFVLAGGIFTYIMTSNGDSKVDENKPGRFTSTTTKATDKTEIKTHGNNNSIAHDLPVHKVNNPVLPIASKKISSIKLNHLNYDLPASDGEKKESQVTLTPVTSNKPSGIDTGKQNISTINVDKEITEHNVELPSPEQIKDTANKAPIIIVGKLKNKESNNNKWRFGISAEAGKANRIQGFSISPPSSSRIAFNTIPNTTSSGSLGSSFYQRTTTTGQLLFGIGISAQKSLTSKLSFQSLIGYQHHQFSTITTIFKDSAPPVLIERNIEKYNLYFLNIYTGISYKIAQFNDLKLSLGAGIDNQFLLAARNEQNKYSFNSGQSIFQKNNSVHAYNGWQPHVRFQLAADAYSVKRNWLQITPYLRYGFRRLEKSGSKDHLVSYGLTTTYFFK